MRSLANAAFLLLSTICGSTCVPGQALAQVDVNGYYRSNGTYVQPYQRTAPDGVRSNNYSYPGNYNPNSGRTTGGGYGGGYGSSGSTQPGSSFGFR